MAALGAALVVFLFWTGSFLVLRWAGDALNPPVATAPSRVPFLGGRGPETHAWSRFHVRYYAMALVFLAFDMEMVFMYPWAVVFLEEGLMAGIEMLMFIAILVLGILYGWREGAFRWA
ncbi:MAG TPA: NADH-quinone oxidoreductase subunit A [Actinomycetota bacterium]